MRLILGRKVGMTRVVDRHGRVVAATVVQALPNTVTQVKTAERDGYRAVQVGAGDLSKAKRPQQGHVKQAKASVGRYLTEVRLGDDEADPTLGEPVTVDQLTSGQIVNVRATSKGRGFAGTVKRHHFTQGPRSHGSMNIRQPGSIGSTYPQRVVKGRRMAGRLGGKRTTVRNLEVLATIPGDHLIVLRGSVPGIRGSLVTLTTKSLGPTQAGDVAAKE